MHISNLLISLQNPIDAFSVKPHHISQIRAALPETRIVVTESKEHFLSHLPEAECGLVWSFKAEWYRHAPKLKTLFTPAAGRDWVASDPSGQVRTIYGSFHGAIMRESLLSMMLYFNRRLEKSLADQKGKQWGRNEYSPSVSLFSQQVLIIGCGALGLAMAELLKAFGARVIGVRRNPPKETPPHIDRMVSFTRLESELPFADHVVLLLPGGTETDGVITAKQFALMKPGAFLYNLGRGNCYQETDLLAALTHGPLAGAALDVFAEEPLPTHSALWEQPNVLITPHSSAISQEYLVLFIREWLEQLARLQ